QRPQRGLAAQAQAGAVAFAREQALVFAQRVLDLAVARQRSVVVDAQPRGGLELGLAVVADAAFGHQSRGLVGQAMPAFAGPGFGVLAGAMHRVTPGRNLAPTVPQAARKPTRALARARPAARGGQKMSNASSSSASSLP